MPFLQFVWDDEENSENHMGVGFALNNYTFDVVNPSSIRFPNLTVIEDIPVPEPHSHDKFTVNLNVSDLDVKDLRISPTVGYVYVEGKREEFNGKSWVHHQVCRRIPLPEGQKVKSVHSKRSPYGTLSITVNMEKIEEAGEVLPLTKTVLVCEGVLQEESTSSGPRQVKLAKIQPKLVRFALQEHFEQLTINLQPTQQVEGNEVNSHETAAREQFNIQIQLEKEAGQPSLGEESVTENTSSSMPIFDVEPAQTVINPEQLRENPDKGEACPRKLADEEEESDENVDSASEESDHRYPNIDPTAVWADLTAIAEDEDNNEWDLEKQGKIHRLPMYVRRVF